MGQFDNARRASPPPRPGAFTHVTRYGRTDPRRERQHGPDTKDHARSLLEPTARDATPTPREGTNTEAMPLAATIRFKRFPLWEGRWRCLQSTAIVWPRPALGYRTRPRTQDSPCRSSDCPGTRGSIDDAHRSELFRAQLPDRAKVEAGVVTNRKGGRSESIGTFPSIDT